MGQLDIGKATFVREFHIKLNVIPWYHIPEKKTGSPPELRNQLLCAFGKKQRHFYFQRSVHETLQNIDLKLPFWFNVY